MTAPPPPPTEAEADAEADAMTRRTMELCAILADTLHGEDPSIAAAVLAEMTSRWLARHFSEDAATTAAYREFLLERHVDTIRQLVPHQETLLLAHVREDSH